MTPAQPGGDPMQIPANESAAVPVPADDGCGNFKLSKLIPAIPPGHVLKIELFEHMWRHEQTLVSKQPNQPK